MCWPGSVVPRTFVDSLLKQIYMFLTTFDHERPGPGDDDKDAASVRTDHPVPFDVSLYYYEVQVVNKGRDGFVGTQTCQSSICNGKQ